MCTRHSELLEGARSGKRRESGEEMEVQRQVLSHYHVLGHYSKKCEDCTSEPGLPGHSEQHFAKQDVLPE